MRQDLQYNDIERKTNMQEYKRIKHTFEPVYGTDSSLLILGSFPSVKSRELGFYYGHPQNRFWKVMGSIFEQNKDILNQASIETKIDFLKKNKVAIWDVIDECDIIGSSDSSIKNVIASDIQKIVSESKIQRIYANGKTAKRLYDKYCFDNIKIEAKLLPSTSPANAAYRLDDLIEKWKIILEDELMDTGGK